jgi:hypothetical protein
MNNSQYTELEKVQLKIKALAAKTVENGATEAEAVSAMHVVGRLLAQYNLTMNEIDVREQKMKTIKIVTNRQRRHPIDSTIIALARLVGAKTWLATKYVPNDGRVKVWNRNADVSRVKQTSYAFFGTEQDLELIAYLYAVIWNAMETETANFKKSDIRIEAHKKGRGFAKSATVAFQRGMAERLAARLNEIRRENEKAMNAKATGTALIVLKGQLIEEEFAKTGIHLRAHHTVRRVGNWSAYHEGQAAANNVNLSRPLTDDTKQVKGLLT